MKNMEFKDWWVLNRDKLATLAELWFIPKKWKDLLLTIVNTFDLVYIKRIESLGASVDDDPPPIIPIIIIGPDGKPVPVPPKPKPPEDFN